MHYCNKRYMTGSEIPLRAHVFTADLMAILRMAVESRKVQLLDIALDLIQKLIAHKHIQGPVFCISHRREATGKAENRRTTEDDEDMDSGGADSSAPQVTLPCSSGSAILRTPCSLQEGGSTVAEQSAS